MRCLCLVALLLMVGRIASAQPLRVRIECEEMGRTKACPAFLLGFVDANPVFLQSPRATADVVVYANAAEVALLDRIHLRFVGNVPGAPPVIELDVDVDSRADDDTQRGQLEPAFLRGMALFVAARFPKLVTVTLGTPEGEEALAKDTRPWDITLNVGGWGNWTERYQSYNGWSSLGIGRVETRQRASLSVGANGGVNKQPPLVVDGQEISISSKNWHVGADLDGAWLYNHCYSVGGKASVWRDDPKGQFRYGSDVQAGVEWDRFHADDPRGNRLAVLAVVGYNVERYNLQNEIGERFARYAVAGAMATGKVRKDKVALGLSLGISGQILHPGRRHHISASPSIEWQLGAHVDLNISFTITKRELPGPDETMIDPTDYALQSRLSYAEPLAMNGSFNLEIHLDRTNGERNDRFTDL